jgi:DUF971 family protein
MDPPSAPAPAPRDIQVDRAAGTLAVAWADLRHVFRLAQLRGCCDCAHCVNEWTGERLLDLATIPPDIVIERLELVGNYAIRPYWSDGHSSGLFTWQRLRSLAEAK